jgi:Family of unknown function (DUF5681)
MAWDIELHRPKRLECAAGRTKGMTMSDVPSPKLPGPVRGRPFEKGRSGNPAGRRPGSRNKATLAAAALLAGEAEALTRAAVELALAGDPTAMRLCIERILPPCRERAVKFILPPIDSIDDISAAMQAVTAALASGDITPGEAATIAGVVETFARAIESTRRRELAVDPLQILAMGDYDETDGYDETDEYDEADEYNETEDCDA